MESKYGPQFDIRDYYGPDDYIGERSSGQSSGQNGDPAVDQTVTATQLAAPAPAPATTVDFATAMGPTTSGVFGLSGPIGTTNSVAGMDVSAASNTGWTGDLSAGANQNASWSGPEVGTVSDVASALGNTQSGQFALSGPIGSEFSQESIGMDNTGSFGLSGPVSTMGDQPMGSLEVSSPEAQATAPESPVETTPSTLASIPASMVEEMQIAGVPLETIQSVMAGKMTMQAALEIASLAATMPSLTISNRTSTEPTTQTQTFSPVVDTAPQVTPVEVITEPAPQVTQQAPTQVTNPGYVGPTGYTAEQMDAYNAQAAANAAQGTPMSQAQTMDQALANLAAKQTSATAAKSDAPPSATGGASLSTSNFASFAPTTTLAPAQVTASVAPVEQTTQVAAKDTPTVSPKNQVTTSTAPAPETAVTPVASSTSTTATPSFWSDPVGSVTGSVSNSLSSAMNNPAQTITNVLASQIPVVGPLNTISGLVGGPTIGGALFGKTSTAPPTEVAEVEPDDYTKGTGTLPIVPETGSTTQTAASPSPTSAPRDVYHRVLTGVPDYLNYGYLPETAFYTSQLAPKAASGGYFDADAYFADGGLVASPRPPVQPTVASQPTMAYTDGQGLVGSIAAPPALSPFNSMGSDAPHASPMAPAPAAAVPTMTPDAPMLSTKNINSSPVSAPISQNPNLGYSLGMSPLARLAGLRNV